MNEVDKISELITSLINLTIRKDIEWNAVTEYMEMNRNEKLRYYIIENNEYYDAHLPKKQYHVEYLSYCVSINSGLVYVFTYYDSFKDEYYHILCVQNAKASNIIELNTSTIYQEDIKTLVFHIKNQFDNIDSFVDFIISKGKSI